MWCPQTSNVPFRVIDLSSSHSKERVALQLQLLMGISSANTVPTPAIKQPLPHHHQCLVKKNVNPDTKYAPPIVRCIVVGMLGKGG